MGKITTDQSHQVLATLAVNTDWAQVDFEKSGLQDMIIRSPKEAGRQFTAFLKNGGKFNSEKWYEQDGVIYLSVISDGTTGPEWKERLEEKGFRISKWANDVLLSPGFKPTNGVRYEIAILKGMLFNDDGRITKKIRAEADKRKLEKPNAEVTCLIRENFSDKEIEAMGLWWIVVMHEPIKDSGGDPDLLGANRRDVGCWLDAYYAYPDYRWNRDSGFAFVVPPQ